MKILFVYRGYGKDLSNSVIDFQRKSLADSGLDISNFVIENGGLKNYLLAIIRLRSFVRKNNIDLIHAHYGFSGFVSGLAFTFKPIICAMMGSDILQNNFLLKRLIQIFNKYLWQVVIVKSLEMQKHIKGSLVIPNGVDFANFRPIDISDAQNKVDFKPADKNIIFVAQNPKSYIKNLELAKKSIEFLKNKKIKLHILSNISFEKLPYYYNAADLILLTSLSEGSPNVIKEAMACNCPIVATDVGDIDLVTKGTTGCYIAPFNPENVAEKIKLALSNDERTNGRKNIKHLDSLIIADKLKMLYIQLTQKGHNDRNR